MVVAVAIFLNSEEHHDPAQGRVVVSFYAVGQSARPKSGGTDFDDIPRCWTNPRRIE